MPQFSSNRTKIFTTFAAIVILTGVLIFFGVAPLLAKVKNSQDRIKANQEELVQLAQAIASYKDLSAKLSQIGDQAQIVSAIFPLREDSVSLVQGLEKAFQEAGLSAQLSIVDNSENATPGTAVPPPVITKLSGIEEVPYTMRFSGDYRQTVNFLIALENTPFLTEVTGFSLSSDTNSSSQRGNLIVKTGTATGEIRAVLFIKKP